MVKIREIRRKAAEIVAKTENDSPLADVDFILSGLGFDKNDILLGEKTLDKKQLKKFENGIKRLEKGEPVQYVVGRCEFMSLMFDVNPETLIPRSDTEILVETVADFCKEKEDIKILEVGSGSGCIAISLAHMLPNAKVVSVDVSQKALDTAKKNAKKNGVLERTTFIKCDILKGFPDLGYLPDVVVSNPPYIPSQDILTLDKKVKAFEPLTALDGGEDGLKFYRSISQNAKLSPGGILAFEVGINQADDVAGFMESRFCNIQKIKDLSGIDRVVVGEISRG